MQNVVSNISLILPDLFQGAVGKGGVERRKVQKATTTGKKKKHSIPL